MIEPRTAEELREHYKALKTRTQVWREPPKRPRPPPKQIDIVDAKDAEIELLRNEIHALRAEISKLENRPSLAPPPEPPEFPRPIPFPGHLFLKAPQVPGFKANCVNSVRDRVAQKYRVEVSDVISFRRQMRTTFIRHVAMYMCKRLTVASYAEIGRRFGGRDHATAIHATRRVELMMAANPAFAEEMNRLEQDLRL